jgi:hypothetical protein
VSSTITLKLRRYAETTVILFRAEYEQAKADGQLADLLDPYLSDMEHESTVMEPDGTEINPYE